MSVCLFVSISVIYQNMNYMITLRGYCILTNVSNVKRSRHGPECDPLVV